MVKMIKLFCMLFMIIPWQAATAQTPGAAKPAIKAEVYYFHPAERCPIDQSIEETTRKLMRAEFAQDIKNGTLKFMVINTDQKENEKVASRFEINSQALYVVSFANGKEVKKDLTEFAFSTCQSNNARFRAGLKEDILEALKH
jgi:hypothetical protein